MAIIQQLTFDFNLPAQVFSAKKHVAVTTWERTTAGQHEFICPFCGKHFFAYGSRIYCSHACRDANYPCKHFSFPCNVCGKPIFRSPSKYNLTTSCSQECRSIHSSRRQLGALSPLWQGGKTSLAMRLRTSKVYGDWRTSVFTRDDFTCQLCHKKGGRLAAHHIKPFHTHQELALVVTNGITLCWPCHTGIKTREVQYEAQFYAVTYAK